VAIARSLANEPGLVLADEPTGNLDSASARRVMALLCRIQSERGTAMVVVTHDQDVAGHAREILSMSDGVIAGRRGSPEKP
jgi:ABC-type lipoprotein export system ATPase subunit